jgi:hypothetical protein
MILEKWAVVASIEEEFGLDIRVYTSDSEQRRAITAEY